MKKGFTLIELLAVIIILAILMVVAVPNVLSTLNDAKEKTFVTQAQSIWKTAEQKYVIDSITGSQKECYDLSNPLNLGSISDSVSYVVEMDIQTGKVKSIKVLDTTQNFMASGVTPNGITASVDTSDTPLSCSNSLGSGSGGSNNGSGGSGGGTAYLDGTIPVAPKLGNMIPIKWTGTKWVYANVSQKWYDYANKEWANAVVLANGVTKNVGDEIAESDIDLWFVWIPRYEYKLPAESIGTTGTPKAIDIKFISSSKTTPTSGYAFHPGFAWDSDWSNGISEWKDGIWIGKFESTAVNTTSNAVQKIMIKANTESWRKAIVSNIYTSGLNLDTDYGLTNLDSHMTRYTEWTAISYLTNSIYGRCSSSTTCAEVKSHTSNTYISGMGDYKTNIELSTNGNVTGIYDIAGSATEGVMGYLSNSTEPIKRSGFITLPTDNRYVDIFISNDVSKYVYSAFASINGVTSMNGVFGELLSNKSADYTWYSDTSWFVLDASPWFALGGRYNEASSNGSGFSGAFYSNYHSGNIDGVGGFRVALT